MGNQQVTAILIAKDPQVWECRVADGRVVGRIEQRDIGYSAITDRGRHLVVEFDTAVKAVERMIFNT